MFKYLRDDGSTISGCWIYCGSYTKDGNMWRAATRPTAQRLGHPKWSWCWPVNRRIIYNRASVNRDGEPFNPQTGRHRLGRRGEEVEGGRARRPQAARATTNPFIMLASGARTPLRARHEGRTIPRALRADREPGQNLLSKVQSSPAVRSRSNDSIATTPPKSSRSSAPPTA